MGFVNIDIAGILLDSNSPRDAASRTLAYLLQRSRARSISLWRLEEDSIALEMSVDADEDTIRGARTLWGSSRAAGADPGASVRGERSILVPTHGVSDSWAYLDGVDPGTVGVDQTSTGAAVAVKALRRTRVGGGRMEDFQALRREELIATLNLYEWNIARVSRAKGVTRKTIYDWLGKLNIPRQYVPK